ncbi:MAG: sigma 54-interacting transcriptional regulator [Ignavibacteriales bacterium]|nr:sigma 54-interacting transcriptional regulator [Ignavibacteriales bacterium]MCB9219541.1 sigma 54-interacting transcriptional regulator [Ignavibacteriales bacterium]MCB9257857.1 sigma 54-interacting transcriptional regulator [Ignavibacteriales bacterium]
MADYEIKNEDILDSLGEGVFTVDKSFRINFFNKAAERITGNKKEEVIGEFCKNVFKSKVCFTECPIALVLNSKKNIYDFESKIKTANEKFIPIKLNAAVLHNEEEKPIGGVISFREVSDLERIEKDLNKDSNFHGIIGKSKPMMEIFELIKEISDSDAPVFIHGESGTGKEMIANAIQQTSIRKDKVFIKINCSVLPAHLLASELFGHVKGAFTDAVKDRPGRFEIADGGTIFLDEVAEMPLQMQLQLLRVLQEGTFERVGESITRRVDVRVIAATNINIEEALRTGKFREDLYYRLNVIPIEIPPLKDRLVDLIPLVKHFLNKFSLLYKKEINDIDDETLELISNFEWRGNIRELENVIEYSFVRTNNSNIITASKLPPMIRGNNNKKRAFNKYYNDEESFEKHQLLDILEKNHWSKTKTAQELKIGRTTLWRKMKQFGIDDQEN